MWGHGGRYADWAEFLEGWARGGIGMERVPGELVQEDFDSATWQRLLARVQNAVEARTTSWSSALSAALGAASDEFSMGRALTQSRSGLCALRDLASVPGLPGDLRQQLGSQIDGQIRSLQQNLEDQASHLRAAGQFALAETYLRAIRDNKLTDTLVKAPLAASVCDPWELSAEPGRRCIRPD